MRLRLFVIISHFVYFFFKPVGIKRGTRLGNTVLETAWLILLREKHTHHEPLFFLIIRLKKQHSGVEENQLLPVYLHVAWLSGGPGNFFRLQFHYNNLKMTPTCSLPLYLTLIKLPFFLNKCLCFMVLTKTELQLGNLKQKQLLGSRRTCPTVCWEV